MSVKKAIQYTVILFAILTLSMDLGAQCAMCRQTAESATEHVNKGIGESLNSGIVYLMMVPYVLIATVGFVFFRKKIVGLFFNK